jgi:hypothetical protein
MDIYFIAHLDGYPYNGAADMMPVGWLSQNWVYPER